MHLMLFKKKIIIKEIYFLWKIFSQLRFMFEILFNLKHFCDLYIDDRISK